MENTNSKYFNYGKLEFTVGDVVNERKQDKYYAVYCDESVEGEFPHDKFIGIFSTRKEAEDCAHTQNILHSVALGYYYVFRVEEICTLSKPKEVTDYQANVSLYYYDFPQYDGKRVHSFTKVILKDNPIPHKDGDVIFTEGDDFHDSQYTLNIFIDLDEMSTKEGVLERAKKLADDYLIEKGLITEPFE